MNVTFAWAAIIAFGLLMYVLLDGFDLGIGLIFPFFPNVGERDMMMHAIAPVWDGNETWLVLGGAALYAAFPLVYSIALSALYLPIIFMLICLIFRGVSFEIRGKADRTKNLWNLAFIAGSAGAAFFQGIILGTYLHGIPIANSIFAGDAFFWLEPFSLFCGLGLMATYALLIFMIAVSIWTPLSDPQIAKRWFDPGLLSRLLPVPFLVAIVAWFMFSAVRRRRHIAPFMLALTLVLLGYLGLLVGIWPYAIPYSLSLADAAAPRSSQIFTLVGAVVILPIIIAYTTAGYWVFRGKVARGGQYH